MTKRIITAIALVLVMAAALLAVMTLNAPQTVQGAKTVTVEVDHLEGDDREFTIHTDAEFLRQALEEIKLVSGPETQYGLWVQTVDGETADDSKQQWWGYTVNGVFAEYGVDQQPVADGDRFVFTLNEGY